MSVDPRELDQIARDIAQYLEDASAASTVERGKAFCRWCLEELFEQDFGNRTDWHFDGPGDGNVDAVWQDGDVLYFLQSKYNHYDRNELIAFCETARILRAGGRSVQSSILQRHVQHLDEVVTQGGSARFLFVTSAQVKDPERLAVQSMLEESGVELWDRTDLVRRLILVQADVPRSLRGVEVRLPATCFMKNKENVDAHIRIADLARLVARYGNDLFAGNVREFRRDSKVQRSMMATLRSEAPEQFIKYNNGIKIVCDEIRVEEDADGKPVLIIRSPQIVNGCQTSSAAHRFLQRVAWADPGAQCRLFLVSSLDVNERRQITRNSNLQLTVTHKDFFSQEDFPNMLARRLEKLGYYLETRTGAWDGLRPAERARHQGKPEFRHLMAHRGREAGLLKIDQVLQAYVAAHLQQPSVAAGQLGALSPNGEPVPLPITGQLFGYRELVGGAPKAAEYFLYPALVYHHAPVIGFGGRRDSEGYQAEGRLFFVMTVFRVLRRLAELSGRTYGEAELELRAQGQILADSDSAQALLSGTASLLDTFFHDSLIESVVDGQYHRFYYGGMWVPIPQPDRTVLTAMNVLDRKIDRWLNSRNFPPVLRSAYARAGDTAD